MYLHDSLGFMKETGPSNDTLSFKWEVKKKKKKEIRQQSHNNHLFGPPFTLSDLKFILEKDY